jgi:hypothetical protein
VSANRNSGGGRKRNVCGVRTVCDHWGSAVAGGLLRDPVNKRDACLAFFPSSSLQGVFIPQSLAVGYCSLPPAHSWAPATPIGQLDTGLVPWVIKSAIYHGTYSPFPNISVDTLRQIHSCSEYRMMHVLKSIPAPVVVPQQAQ